MKTTMSRRTALTSLVAFVTSLAGRGPVHAGPTVSGSGAEAIRNDRGTYPAAEESLMSATTQQDVTRSAPAIAPAPDNASPFPGFDAMGDYELTVNIDFDFQGYGGAKLPPTYGRYQIFGGRRAGKRRMKVVRILVEDTVHGEDILAEADDQVVSPGEDPDILERLQDLLLGQGVFDGTRARSDLRDLQMRALRIASPELRRDIIALLARNGLSKEDEIANSFGSWLLTASDSDLDGAWHSDEAYGALMARVKAERLAWRAQYEAAKESLWLVSMRLERLERARPPDETESLSLAAD